MQDSIRYCVVIRPDQQKIIQSVIDNSELSRSELIRRVLDFAMQPTYLNEMIPRMSGQFNNVGK